MTPPQASTSKATRPPSSIILDTEQTKQTTFVQETANNYIEKIDNNEESEYKTQLTEITEDVDAAIILLTALRDRLISIKTTITSREQICEFDDEIRDKVKLVSRIAKKKGWCCRR